jgi:hypothetical protein
MTDTGCIGNGWKLHCFLTAHTGLQLSVLAGLLGYSALYRPKAKIDGRFTPLLGMILLGAGQ